MRGINMLRYETARPLFGARAATLPQGHTLIEPYLFDIITNGHFDTSGNKHAGRAL